MEAIKATQASIDHVNALAASAEPGTAKLAHTYAENIQARLTPIHAISVAQVKADFAQQQQAYAQAQDVIAHTPTKDRNIALAYLLGMSAAQKAYNEALKVKKPDPVSDFMRYAMDQAQRMTSQADSVRIYAASDEQAIASMVGAQAPKTQPVAVIPVSTPVAAPVVASVSPAPAPVATPAITANSGNNLASSNDANTGLFRVRSPAAPKVTQKVTISAPVRREPIITKSTPIVRTPTVVPVPRRPAESDGFIEQ